jgi:hypothetical protein
MHNRSLVSILAAGAVLAAALPAAAQSDSIRACYVPTTGNVYRIGTPDTHPDCVAPSHVRFAWATPDLGIGGGYLLRLRSGAPPTDRFRVDSAGGVAALGQFGSGINPASGAGTRMTWFPGRGVFRVGSVDGTQWDDGNTGDYSFAGGNNNTASQYGAFAYGDGNSVSSLLGAAFGNNNLVSGTVGFAAGGSNRCTGLGCTAIGFSNNAGGQGSVALGYHVTANADFSTAIGYRASVRGHSGAMVFGDQSTFDSVQAVANNEFVVRASGGFRFRTNPTLTTGCDLPAGSGVFSCSSSRSLKEHFAEVDGEALLARVRGVPVSRWSYIAEGGRVRHLGPFAEDFHAAFGLGTDDRSIGLLDIDGVNFAAVKALEARTEELLARTAEVERLRAEVASLRERQAATDARLAELEALVRQNATH